MVLFAVSTSLSFDTQSEDRLRVFGSYWSSGWAASHQLNRLVAIAGDRHAEIITTDVSVRGYFARLACEELGTGVAAALLAFLAIWVARRRLDVFMASKLGLVVAILASPLAWFHYTLLLLPALIERPWGKTLSLAACLLLVPIDVPLSSIRSSGLVLALGGGIYFGAVCLICWAFFREAWCAGAVQSDPGTPLRASLPDR
ncbi:hypothetical protein [Cupriavidus sp. IK-TO18]|uniref:hypothetical protein n=1 Tax=Cupriavidus sp. IK-TO18 TaxID=2782182 RepID=UPI001898CDC2|nr:hypothetical protein [Cupriavidus sp. IK-TO18]MBF6991684.1 hypothetical protein [Cupriavidus sp. IK-TO18]